MASLQVYNRLVFVGFRAFPVGGVVMDKVAGENVARTPIACAFLVALASTTQGHAQQDVVLFDTLDGLITVIEVAVAASEPEPEPVLVEQETLIACFGHPEQPYTSHVELEQVLKATEDGTQNAKSFVSQIPNANNLTCPVFAAGLLDAADAEVASIDEDALKASALHLISCSDPGAQSLNMETIQELQSRIGAAIRGHESATRAIAEKRVSCGFSG